MRAGRDAMQDVEIVEREDGLDAVDLDGPVDEADAARARRLARRRRSAQVLRLLRRWWPVPLVLVIALVAVQVVQRGQEDAAVDRRRQVEGVLPEIDRDLRVREFEDDEDLWVAFSALHVEDLEITTPALANGEDDRVLAASRDGEEIWRTSLEDVPAHRDRFSSSSADCALDGSQTRVICRVDDWAPVASESGAWEKDVVAASRLVVVATADGSVLDRRTVPAGARTLIDDDRVYVVSASDDVLTVEARDAADDTLLWSTAMTLDGSVPVREGDMPWPTVSGDYLLVGSYQPTWALDLADGHPVASSETGLAVGRSGLLLETGGSLRRAEDASLLTDAGTHLLTAQVDDGSDGALELVQRVDGTEDQTITAVDSGSGRTVWSVEVGDWDGYSLLVLDGVVYGCGTQEIWAIDLATGHRVWTAEREQGIVGTLLTDGRYLLTTEWAVQPMAVSDDDAAVRQPARSDDGHRLVAHRLSDGSRAWESPLPGGVDAITTFGDQLLGYSSNGDGTTVLLD